MPEVLIRRVEARDAAALAAAIASPGAVSGTLQQPYPSEALWRERISGMSPQDHMLVAEVDGVVVGSAGLHGNANPRRAHAAGLGISITDAWQGHGIGRKLLTALLDLADNWLGLLRLELSVFADNEKALALYRSVGFVEEGRLRGFALRAGRYVDVITMARFHPNPPRISPENDA
ncbi:GNAT family N-acetyltransferase [Niveibacterium terrae]|uniref:GNAT family N-acetyltransferase n=1 Tax=Niveibacterium terrae TaxID=3373598 RepID=UPI003A930E05